MAGLRGHSRALRQREPYGPSSVSASVSLRVRGKPKLGLAALLAEAHNPAFGTAYSVSTRVEGEPQTSHSLFLGVIHRGKPLRNALEEIGLRSRQLHVCNRV